ncbi:MAG: hemolysin family protein [Methanomicrobiales archaeon]|nr:hemolysin family protein [Methanomicrobiales archaeon]
MISITVLTILFIVCLVFSAIFSSSEVAIISITRARVRLLLQTKDRRAEHLASLKKTPDHTLITILIGNNIVNVAAASLATSIAIDIFGDAGVGIATFVVVLLLLVFGEIGPKIFAVRATESLALRTAPFIHFLSRVFFPFLWIYDRLSGTSHLTVAFAKPGITEEEIKGWIDLGKEEGAIEQDERELLYSVLEFSDTIAREVMTPRPDTVMIEDTQTPDQAIKVFNDTGYSRLPVFHDQIDNIVGILNVKDIFPVVLRRKEGVQIKDVMKEPYLVPETKKIDDLLKEMRQKKVHMAVVVDEYGSFTGIVTIEDILEELVGEIQDEHDKEEPQLQQIEEGVYLVGGRMWVEDLNEELSLDLPITEDYETIAGLVTERLGHIPRKGETVYIEESGVTCVVMQMRRNRIASIKLISPVHQTTARSQPEGVM